MNRVPPAFDSDDELEELLNAISPAEQQHLVTEEREICAVCDGDLDDIGVQPLPDGSGAPYPTHPIDHVFIPLERDGARVVRGQRVEVRTLLERQVAQDRERALWGFGRALQRLAAQDREYEVYLLMVQEEVARHRERIAVRMAMLDRIICEAALAQRALDPRRKSLTIPGVGTWQTRETQPGWDLPTRKAEVEALIDDLSPDERKQYVKQVEELDTTAFRARLDDLLAKGVAAALGERVEEGATVAPEVVRAVTTEEATDLADAYGERVRFRPAGVAVKGPFTP